MQTFFMGELVLIDMLLLAGALVLFFEGILYALFPDGMKRMMISVIAMPSGSLRMLGLVAAIIGLFLVWILKSW